VDSIAESESLHVRVRAFAAGGAGPGETFETLALDVARFQACHAPGYARLVDRAKSSLDQVEQIPAVPTEAFRVTRVAAHPAECDEARFLTSGTTGPPGVHSLRTTRTYRELALRSGRAALTSGWPGRSVVVALAPAPGDPVTSSLGFMLRTFMEVFDGRELRVDPDGARFDGNSPARWLAGPGGIDVDGLVRAAGVARKRHEPLLILATSFALVVLLDALGEHRIAMPRRTVLMQTGGYKGRTRAVEPAALRAAIARAFRLPSEHVVGEYGMTELTSQLYEGVLRGVYLPPPWLRVTPVDPATLEPVPEGEVGIARFVDLGNVDSAVAIVTQDLVRARAGGIELLGRRPGAEPRGCSLAMEALVAGGRAP
jgi:hypothetical protein